mmetsp:Transcript_23508/g.41331  ORF Transcript_23508/g.41331 Transcript_23508/m.41331 type:complete len:126 (+) Transcript_23508:71-448(+)
MSVDTDNPKADADASKDETQASPDSAGEGTMEGRGSTASRDSGGGELVSSPSTHSILKGKSGRKSRSDSKGELIDDKKKKHSCNFPDLASPGTPVAEVKEVEQMKVKTWGAEQDGADSGCKCTLL